MSYILDALRKADQERSIGDVPDLDASHWGARRRVQRNYWIWIILALMLLNAALVFVMMSGDEDVATPAAAVQPSGQPSKSAAGGNTVMPEPPLDAADTSFTRARVPKPPPPVQPVRSAPVPSAVMTQPRPVPVPASAKPTTSGSNLPEWGELSLEFRSEYPLPHIDVHVHDEDPARRFIMIELKKYREGQTLDSGAKLDRINPESVELNYQGTRFRVDR